MEYAFLLVTFFFLVMFLLLAFLHFLGLFLKQPNLPYKPVYSRFYIAEEEYETISLSHSDNNKDLFIVHLPGNPGIIGFYENYFSLLYHKFGGKINIIGTSNKGLLSIGWREYFRNGFLFCPRFTLRDQVKYHSNFVKFLIKCNPQAKFILTAHSLGSYTLLEILKDFPKEKIVKGIMICPAIENLAKSPKGLQFPYKESKKWDWFIYFSAFIFSFFFYVSAHAKRGLMSLIFTKDLNMLNYVIRLHEFNVGLNYINLGGESLRYVNDLNVQIIQRNQKKLWFLYVMYDEWIPITLYDKMRNKFKKAHFEIDNGTIGHAFIFQGLQEAADYTYNCILSKNN